MLIKKILILFAFLCFVWAVNAQQLYLTSGTFHIREGLHIKGFSIKKEQKKVAAVLTFKSLPTAKERKALKSMGIDLYHYLPKNSYIASLSVNEKGIVRYPNLDYFSIYAVMPFKPEWKIHNDLLSENLPYWIVKGNGIIEVYASIFPFYEGIATQMLHTVANSVSETPFPNTYVLNINKNRLHALANLYIVRHIAPTSAPGKPENYQGKTNHRSNYISSSYATGLHYDGTGVTVMMNDDGLIGPHIDYTGRVDQTTASGSSPSNDHGDHVAGIIMGAGNLDPRLAGMATGANLVVYNYPDGLLDFPNAYVNRNTVITSTSYSNGCNAGYTSFAQLLDQTAIDHYSLLHVFSAGNQGTNDCGYGAGTGWGVITGGHKIGKNVIAVAAADKNSNIVYFSSRGPAHDGRIKPDVTAVGYQVLSTNDPNNYVSKSGTSMSCPGISGVLAQMYDVYKSLNSQTSPPGALMKAILLNSADDRGVSGPDFTYGFGRVNAKNAYEAISGNTFLQDSIANGDTNTHTIAVPVNVEQVKVMVYWHDAPASTSASRALVNNLDMTLTDPSNNTWLPWVLNPAPNPNTLNDPAVRAVDTLNNMEQITLNNPAQGNYTVSIYGTSVPIGGNQEYFVVYEFRYDEVTLTYPIGGEGFTPGEPVKVRWDSYGPNGAFQLSYSTNGGNSFATINNNISAAQRYYVWTTPLIVNGNMLLKIERGSISDVSDTTFSIIGTPTNIQFDTVCGSTFALSWNAVSNATSYNVYALGQKYMELEGTTSTTSITLNNLNPAIATWFAVSANGINNAKGRRSIAVQAPSNFVNCTANAELEIQLVNPTSGNLNECFVSDSVYIKVDITNNATQAASNFPVTYVLNNGTPVTETFNGFISPSQTTTFTFSQPIDLSISGSYVLDVYTALTGDINLYNDTTHATVQVNANSAVAMPYYENFETFSLCSNASNCGAIICNLTNGWKNLTNGSEDDIDWRVSEGATPSSGTGPNVDYDPGNVTGNYIYLEASGCFGNTGVMYTPCIELTSSNPYLSFAYHMYGSDMGTLHVDMYANGSWISDITASISGNQGPQWQVRTENLSAYSGQKVTFRFRGTTGPSYQSDIAIDAFKVFGIQSEFSYNYSGNTLCVGDIVTFTDSSIGNITNYLWDFGNDASPATASSVGPHNVTYSTAGNKTIQLTIVDVNNDTAFKTEQIFVDTLPIANFNYNPIGLTVFFQNISTLNANSFYWEFGDGNNSTSGGPSHTYTSDGTYTVKLIATNACGSDTITKTITVKNVGIQANLKPNFSLFPNPTEGFVAVKGAFSGNENVYLTDLTGRIIKRNINTNNAKILVLDVGFLSNGMYYLVIKHNGTKTTLPLIKIQP